MAVSGEPVPPQSQRSVSGLLVGVSVVVGVVLVVLFALAWTYQTSQPAAEESQAEGSGPVARFKYHSAGKQESELFVVPIAGTSLADLFDMSLFEDLKPGMTQIEFEKHYGSKQFEAPRAVLEVGLENDRDSLGTVSWRPAYAYPKPGSGGIALSAVVNPVVAREIQRTHFVGLLILADSADRERLFCSVEGTKIFKLRWVRLAA